MPAPDPTRPAPKHSPWSMILMAFLAGALFSILIPWVSPCPAGELSLEDFSRMEIGCFPTGWKVVGPFREAYYLIRRDDQVYLEAKSGKKRQGHWQKAGLRPEPLPLSQVALAGHGPPSRGQREEPGHRRQRGGGDGGPLRKTVGPGPSATSGPPPYPRGRWSKAPTSPVTS